MIKHLKPLFTKASINSKMFSQVFVDKGAIVNVMPLISLNFTRDSHFGYILVDVFLYTSSETHIVGRR
jgi:hypothetical protein